MITLIDADSIYFRAAMANQQKKEIRTIINRTMSEIKGFHLESDIKVAVKGRGNFRKDMYPEYKAKRPSLPDHIRDALNYGHKYMVDQYDAIMADGMEADDLVCIWAYEARDMEMPYSVVGIDKDLLQIPGHHYNFVKKEAQVIDDDNANYNLMVQCLCGDTSDNIPGIKGIGPKKAAGILAGVPEVRRWSRIRAAYRAHHAGDPWRTWRLLSMITSWEELEDVKSYISSEASKRKQNVQQEGEDNLQIS